MQPLQFLAHLLLSVTLGTLVVALAAYVAYKSRERRRPATTPSSTGVHPTGPIFLRREVLADMERAPNCQTSIGIGNNRL